MQQIIESVPRRTTRTPRVAVRKLVALTAFLTASASAQATHDASLFSISKSENRNEVIYAIHLDGRCAPLGEAPVYAFWRMNERHGAVEPLLRREEPAYGIGYQRVTVREPDGGSVDVAMRALPSRHIIVRTQQRDGACRTTSTLTIAGAVANLTNIDVKLKPLGVDYFVLSGLTSGGVVHEKVEH